MYGYYEDKDLSCYIYAPNVEELSDDLRECIESNKSYPLHINIFKYCKSVEEVNAAMEQFKTDTLNKHNFRWCVVGLENDLPCERWEGHYFPVSEFSKKSFRDISLELSYLTEKGVWWDYANRYERQDLVEGFEKVIFLDIDGVLNRDDGKEYFVDEFLENLAAIVKKTGAEIILSSSWRHAFLVWAQQGFPEVEEYGGKLLYQTLAKYGLHLSGTTPEIFNGPDGRPFEIRTWLSNKPDVRRFVILDDEEFWKWNWLWPHVVTTCDWEEIEVERDGKRRRKRVRKCGLTKAKMERAIAILSE